MIFKKKISARRKQVRENISAEKVGRLGDLIDSGIPVSLLILLGFGALTVGLFSIDAKNGILGWKSSGYIVSWRNSITYLYRDGILCLLLPQARDETTPSRYGSLFDVFDLFDGGSSGHAFSRVVLSCERYGGNVGDNPDDIL